MIFGTNERSRAFGCGSSGCRQIPGIGAMPAGSAGLQRKISTKVHLRCGRCVIMESSRNSARKPAMLNPFIIDQIKRREHERRRQQDREAVLELPLPMPA